MSVTSYLYVMTENSWISPRILALMRFLTPGFNAQWESMMLEATVPLLTNSLRNLLGNEWVRVNLMGANKTS